MKAEINIFVDNFAQGRGVVSVDLVMDENERPTFYVKGYEEHMKFYISEKDDPCEIYRALKDAEVNVYYSEE